MHVGEYGHMKTLDELKARVQLAIDDANGDRDAAIASLTRLVEEDPEFLLGFATYGAELIQAMLESLGEVKH